MFTVGSDPHSYHSAWASFGDHTTGSGKMMIINTADTGAPYPVIWSQAVNVVAGTQYQFKVWLAMSYPTAPPMLKLYAGDEEVGSFDGSAAFTPDPDNPGHYQTGQWVEVVYSWTAASTGTVTFALKDETTIYMGGDYCLDDIQLCPVGQEQEVCWADETAWAAGSRYVRKGNWATYTSYNYNGTETTVTLYAGQTMEAGTVTFSAPDDGKVTITITLNEGWRFNPDEMENLKVQDYATAPSGNPAPGLFAKKKYCTESPCSIEVPLNNYYGVHVDVQREVECPVE